MNACNFNINKKRTVMGCVPMHHGGWCRVKNNLTNTIIMRKISVILVFGKFEIRISIKRK